MIQTIHNGNFVGEWLVLPISYKKLLASDASISHQFGSNKLDYKVTSKLFKNRSVIRSASTFIEDKQTHFFLNPFSIYFSLMF